MKALHVPFTYFPSPHGGTEVYVASLANELLRHGVASVIAAPGDHNETYEWEGMGVHRFKISAYAGLETIYGEGDAGGAAEFGNILDRVRPDLVHFHALTPGASVLAMREVKKRDIPLIFTYHSPTVSCVRSSLMKWGNTVCDGVMNARICSACAMCGKGLPKYVSLVAAAIQADSLAWLGRKAGIGRMATAMQMPALVRKRHATTRATFELADQVVAVCDWVRNLLLVNGVPADKIKLCRQGLPGSMPVATHVDSGLPTSQAFTSSRPLRIAYFGRLDITKGVQVVIGALLKKPSLPISFDIYGIPNGAAGAKWREQLIGLSGGDNRIHFCSPVKSGEVPGVMRAYDLIAVPSLWLETGPLVV